MIFWISSDSAVITSFSFLILLIRILPQCPQVSLANGLCDPVFTLDRGMFLENGPFHPDFPVSWIEYRLL